MKMEQRYIWSWVETQVTQTVEVWNDCAGRSLPPFPRFSPKEQGRRESAYDRGLRSVDKIARHVPRTTGGLNRTRQQLVDVFPPFATVALGLKPEAVELLIGVFLRSGTELTRWARSFDPELTVGDTIQACRNAWTACGLQALLGQPMRLTGALAAYSMLYPYSDNYLDHPSLTRAEKLAFSERFRQRLGGQRFNARDHLEAAVWAMVELIERQYPRASYPQVFESLLAIHRAQEESVAQLGGNSGITEIADDQELLRISCAKGGTSVLADACLADPWLTAEESRFAFEWGVLLQLGDDLQDVNDDLRRGSATLFTQIALSGQPLDGLVAQLLNFSHGLGERMERLPHGSEQLKDLLRLSWRSLILMAVADAQPLFTKTFLAELEPLSAFRFDFLRERNGNLAAREALYTRLFDAFAESSFADPVSLPAPNVAAPDDLPKSGRMPGVEAALAGLAAAPEGCMAQ